jgi:CRISPR/Cas system CMR subunit Cmr4 (Cas7 group RAMP superfamily)
VDLSEISRAGRSTIYDNGKEDPWYTRLAHKTEELFGTGDAANARQHNGMVELYDESPWFMPRIHKIVEIFALVSPLENVATKRILAAKKAEAEKEAQKARKSIN